MSEKDVGFATFYTLQCRRSQTIENAPSPYHLPVWNEPAAYGPMVGNFMASGWVISFGCGVTLGLYLDFEIGLSFSLRPTRTISSSSSLNDIHDFRYSNAKLFVVTSFEFTKNIHRSSDVALKIVPPKQDISHHQGNVRNFFKMDDCWNMSLSETDLSTYMYTVEGAFVYFNEIVKCFMIVRGWRENESRFMLISNRHKNIKVAKNSQISQIFLKHDDRKEGS